MCTLLCHKWTFFWRRSCSLLQCAILSFVAFQYYLEITASGRRSINIMFNTVNSGFWQWLGVSEPRRSGTLSFLKCQSSKTSPITKLVFVTTPQWNVRPLTFYKLTAGVEIWQRQDESDWKDVSCCDNLAIVRLYMFHHIALHWWVFKLFLSGLH